MAYGCSRRLLVPALAAVLLLFQVHSANAVDRPGCLSPTTYDITEYPRGSGECLGHGKCTNNTCACEPGWRSSADFLPLVACVVHDDVVQPVYAVLFFLSSAIFVISVILTVYHGGKRSFMPDSHRANDYSIHQSPQKSARLTPSKPGPQRQQSPHRSPPSRPEGAEKAAVHPSQAGDKHLALANAPSAASDVAPRHVVIHAGSSAHETDIEPETIDEDGEGQANPYYQQQRPVRLKLEQDFDSQVKGGDGAGSPPPGPQPPATAPSMLHGPTRQAHTPGYSRFLAAGGEWQQNTAATSAVTPNHFSHTWQARPLYQPSPTAQGGAKVQRGGVGIVTGPGVVRFAASSKSPTHIDRPISSEFRGHSKDAQPTDQATWPPPRANAWLDGNTAPPQDPKDTSNPSNASAIERSWHLAAAVLDGTVPGPVASLSDQQPRPGEKLTSHWEANVLGTSKDKRRKPSGPRRLKHNRGAICVGLAVWACRDKGRRYRFWWFLAEVGVATVFLFHWLSDHGVGTNAGTSLCFIFTLLGTWMLCVFNNLKILRARIEAVESATHFASIHVGHAIPPMPEMWVRLHFYFTSFLIIAGALAQSVLILIDTGVKATVHQVEYTRAFFLVVAFTSAIAASAPAVGLAVLSPTWYKALSSNDPALTSASRPCCCCCLVGSPPRRSTQGVARSAAGATSDRRRRRCCGCLQRRSGRVSAIGGSWSRENGENVMVVDHGGDSPGAANDHIVTLDADEPYASSPANCLGRSPTRQGAVSPESSPRPSAQNGAWGLPGGGKPLQLHSHEQQGGVTESKSGRMGRDPATHVVAPPQWLGSRTTTASDMMHSLEQSASTPGRGAPHNSKGPTSSLQASPSGAQKEHDAFLRGVVNEKLDLDFLIYRQWRRKALVCSLLFHPFWCAILTRVCRLPWRPCHALQL